LGGGGVVCANAIDVPESQTAIAALVLEKLLIANPPLLMF
jgi:hypothetical protein